MSAVLAILRIPAVLGLLLALLVSTGCGQATARQSVVDPAPVSAQVAVGQQAEVVTEPPTTAPATEQPATTPQPLLLADDRPEPYQPRGPPGLTFLPMFPAPLILPFDVRMPSEVGIVVDHVVRGQHVVAWAAISPVGWRVGAVRTVGFRYYNPVTGRYISRDPIGYGDGMNVYAHVHNNPINRIDPLGLDDKKPEEKPKPKDVDKPKPKYPISNGIPTGPRELPNNERSQAWKDEKAKEKAEAEAQQHETAKTSPEGDKSQSGGGIVLWKEGDAGRWAHYINTGEAGEATPADAAGLLAGPFGRLLQGAKQGAKALNYLYQKVGKDGKHLKFGITKNPETRYTKEQLAGGKLRIVASGERQEMLRLEREAHETLPIGPEERQAIYIQKQIEKGLTPPPYGK